MSNITTQSLTSLVVNIKNKELSSEEVTKAFIERSEKSKELNSYISEDFSNAIDKAKKFDQNPNFDTKLPGIPMAVKDLFCTENVRTTAGSKILENFVKKSTFFISPPMIQMFSKLIWDLLRPFLGGLIFFGQKNSFSAIL